MPKIKYKPLFILLALLLAWGVDFLWYGRVPGINFPIWFGTAILALFLLALVEGKRIPFSSLVLAILTELLAVAPFLRAPGFSSFFPILMAVAALSVLAVTLTNGYWVFFRLGDYLTAALHFCAAALTRGARSQAGEAAITGSRQYAPRRRSLLRQSLPWLRGALLAIPVLLVLSALLAQADATFERMLNGLFNSLLNIENPGEYLFRFIYIVALFYFAAGILYHAIYPHPELKKPDPNQPFISRFLGSTEAFIVLGSVAALFIFFVTLQIPYLFGGTTNVRVGGFTYSEYARKGFFELVWVAVLSFLLYIALSAITKREKRWEARVFTALAALLFLCVLTMLVSAHQRLVIYEQAYGFTRLRTYTHVFLYWLAALLLVTVILEVLRRPGRLGLAFFLTAIGFSLTFAWSNLDGMIAAGNVRFAEMNGEIDQRNLLSLSIDAVPVLAESLKTQSNDHVRDQIGQVLTCKRIDLDHQARRDSGWRSLSLSRQLANNALQAADLSPWLTFENNLSNGSDEWTPEDFTCYDYMD